MTLFHLSVERGHACTHDDRDAPSVVIGIEMFGLVLALWIGVRR